MEWVDRMNQALDAIEANLTQSIDPEQLAKIACCSSYHFQRMFSFMAGASLAEYIRRRRMTLAGVELRSGDAKVLDVALKYGYASPTAFNRAFQSVHGVPPSAAKEPQALLKAYPKLHFVLTVKGAEELQYRVERQDAFRIVGISRPLKAEIEHNFQIVPQMWAQAAMDGTMLQLAALMDGEPAGLLGVSACAQPDQWQYWIAVASGAAAQPPMQSCEIPAATWAIFPGQGDGASMQELERRIVLEWLPTSGYEYADAPDVEVYLSSDPAHMQYEVWIPVTKK